MEIETRAPEPFLEEFRLFLTDELIQHGYTEGPKIKSMESGIMIEYLKNNWIVSLQISEESEQGESFMRLQSEREIPELNEIWDAALISFGKQILLRLRNFAVDKAKVSRELKAWAERTPG